MDEQIIYTVKVKSERFLGKPKLEEDFILNLKFFDIDILYFCIYAVAPIQNMIVQLSFQASKSQWIDHYAYWDTTHFLT